MWYDERVFYQIYPLGFCDALDPNADKGVNRLKKISDWLDYFNKLAIGAIIFNPIFQSSNHGYDTVDFLRIDERLGNNQDFKGLVTKFHACDIKVILDGVFNHVGREFWAFKDVRENGQNSQYCNWFLIDFNGNSNYNDGFYYQGWEGHYELVELNLANQEVVNYLLGVVEKWISEFDIDGIRLDVAYSLNEDFLRQLKSKVYSIKKDFFLLGEIIHGDYRRIMNDEMLNSVTNYQAYKGMWSSFNSYNFFEIAHTFNEHFVNSYPNNNTLLFVDNHDVTRCASILNNPNHLKLIYALLLTAKGIPCLYYGSEWKAEGLKKDGDEGLRKSYNEPLYNDFTAFISKLIRIRNKYSALQYGDYKQIFLTNKQYIYSRSDSKQTLYFAANMADTSYYGNCNLEGSYYDLISDKKIICHNGFELESYQAYLLVADTDIDPEDEVIDQLKLARDNINRIDQEMGLLFTKRMEEVEAVIKYKLLHNLPILDSNRENEVIERNVANLKSKKYEIYYIEYIKMLMGISKKYQAEILNKSKENKKI